MLTALQTAGPDWGVLGVSSLGGLPECRWPSPSCVLILFSSFSCLPLSRYSPFTRTLAILDQSPPWGPYFALEMSVYTLPPNMTTICGPKGWDISVPAGDTVQPIASCIHLCLDHRGYHVTRGLVTWIGHVAAQKEVWEQSLLSRKRNFLEGRDGMTVTKMLISTFSSRIYWTNLPLHQGKESRAIRGVIWYSQMCVIFTPKWPRLFSSWHVNF